MASISETREFSSWVQALAAGILTPEQLATLQSVVDDGQAPDLKREAQLLDWQETVIDPEEHMRGF